MSSTGRKIDCYRVQRKLGAGGMGEVYLAWDESLDRNVAIKLIRSSLLADPKSQKRFRREARTSAGLSHPCIVQTFRVLENHSEAGEAVDCLVMEYIAGCSLRQLMNQERLPFNLAIRIFIQIAEGLSHAHDRGVIHRDLKAENVMLTADLQVKILDFGLAKQVSTGESSMTGGGALVGTLYSMAPEQAAGLPLDHRADLFSLGVLAYELFSGHRPFVGETAHELWLAVMQKAPTPIREHEASLPQGLADLIERLLEKNPEERVQQAKEVLAVLDPGSASDPAISLVSGMVRLEDLPETLRSRLVEALPPDASDPPQILPFTTARWRWLRPGFLASISFVTVFVGVVLLVFWPRAIPERSSPAIAVLPFAGEGGALCRRIFGELWRAHEGVAVLRPDLVQLASASTSLAAGQPPGTRELAEIQGMLAPDYLIYGTCSRTEEGMKVAASLLRAENGSLVSSFAESWDSDWETLAKGVERFSAAMGLPIAELGLPSGIFPRKSESLWPASSGFSALEVGTTEAVREARQRFEQALEVEPQQPWLIQNLAGIRRLADPDSAFYLLESIANVPENAALPRAGRRLLAMSSAERNEVLDPAKAAIEWSYLTAQGFNQDPSLILETADNLLGIGRPRAALAWLENGKFHGTLLLAHQRILKAKAWYQLTEYGSAAAAAEAALELRPPDLLEARALFEMGNANADQGKAGEAQAAYERAEKIFDLLGRTEELFSCREGIVLLLIGRGQEVEARSRLIKLWEAYSHYQDSSAFARLSSNLAAQLESAGDFKGAIELYSESIDLFERLELAPEAAMARQNRAAAYHNQGRFSEARRDYLLAEEALRKLGAKENVAAVLTNLGELDVFENKWKSAERYFEESSKIAGTDRDPASEAYFLLQRAWLSRARGNLAAAEADLERATQLQVGIDFELEIYWGTRISVAQLQLAKLNFGNALEMARQILLDLKQTLAADPQLARGPSHFEVLKAKLLLARILLEKQAVTVADRDEARSLIQQVLLDPRCEQRFMVLADAKSLEAKL